MLYGVPELSYYKDARAVVVKCLHEAALWDEDGKLMAFVRNTPEADHYELLPTPLLEQVVLFVRDAQARRRRLKAKQQQWRLGNRPSAERRRRRRPAWARARAPALWTSPRRRTSASAAPSPGAMWDTTRFEQLPPTKSRDCPKDGVSAL